MRSAISSACHSAAGSRPNSTPCSCTAQASSSSRIRTRRVRGRFATGEASIDSDVSLGWWTSPSGKGGEVISLHVLDSEVCATISSVELTPYESEYEGYMGNYGNTMDRWYRRAALVVWPRAGLHSPGRGVGRRRRRLGTAWTILT